MILNGVLKWEQPFFPAVIGGVLTFVFIILWWIDLSLLTLVAFTLLLTTVLDYGYPFVSKFIFKAENWSGSQEKLYEQIINDIVDIKVCVSGSITSFFNSRAEKSTFVSSCTLYNCSTQPLINLTILVPYNCNSQLIIPRIYWFNVQQSLPCVFNCGCAGHVSRLEGKGHCQEGFGSDKGSHWTLFEENSTGQGS